MSSPAGDPMRAVMLRDGGLDIEEIPVPQPGPGELLLRIEACGICGSDLGARRDAEALAAAGRLTGKYFQFDPDAGRCSATSSAGSWSAAGRTPATGCPTARWVVALPTLPRPHADELIGFSNEVPGGFAQHVVVHEPFTFVVPDGLDADVAALTEPLAVARHTVAVELSKTVMSRWSSVPAPSDSPSSTGWSTPVANPWSCWTRHLRGANWPPTSVRR